MRKIILLLAAAFVSIATTAQDKIQVPLRFDRYYSYAEMVEALQALNKAYPKLTSLQKVGQSEENRDIWAITINNPDTGKDQDKPGVYVDGNIHGNEIQAGEVCLYFAQYLLKNYSENPQIKKMVDKNAYYIVPVINVDGRYHFFADPNTMHSNRSIRRPHDDDRDGLVDEDFPDDLNKDGSITQMRKTDPNGQWKTDPEDPRIMVRVKDGEKGTYTLLGDEGIDNDNDGRVNEDAEGFVDPNRNWGYNWQPPYVQRGAGDFPLSGAGLRAVAKFIIARPNIILTYAFHNYGGMFLRGPSTEAHGELHPNDIKVFDFLGHNAEKIVPGYRYLISWSDLYPTQGDFTDFTDNIAASFGFVGELFYREQETFYNINNNKKLTGIERDRELLKFNDHLAHGTLFKNWEKYNHPQYGEIEIGGWVKMSSRLPHPFMLTDLVHRNASAVIFAAEQTPEISMKVTDSKKISGNLYQVDVAVTNSTGIPTLPYSAIQNKSTRQDMLTLSGAKVVASGTLSNPFSDKVKYKEHRPELQLFYVPGFSTIYFRFLVEGSNITLEYNALKTQNITLKHKL